MRIPRPKELLVVAALAATALVVWALEPRKRVRR